jgi:hypothetical protein
MPRCPVHHHPCEDCGAKTECGGVWEQNYDGFPEVICPEYHKDGGWVEFVCETCHNKREADANPDRG